MLNYNYHVIKSLLKTDIVHIFASERKSSDADSSAFNALNGIMEHFVCAVFEPK